MFYKHCIGMIMLKQYDEGTLDKIKRVEIQVLSKVQEVCEKNNIAYCVFYGTLLGTIRHKGFIPWDEDVDIVMFREDYEKFISIFDREAGSDYCVLTASNTKYYTGPNARVHKRGTKFVPECLKNIKYNLGVFVDIFVLDKAPLDSAILKRLYRKERFYSMLCFLASSGTPTIEIGGLKGKMAKLACRVIHGLLCLWPGANAVINAKFHRLAQSYNQEDTTRYVVYQNVTLDVFELEDFLPFRQAQFEDITVYIPNHYDKILKQVYGDYMTLPPVEERVNHAACVIELGD